MLRTPVAITLAAMLSYSARAGADLEESGVPMFSFSGFGTLGVVHSSEDRADFTPNFFKPNGAGHTRRWSPDVDSLIGAQVTANLAPRLSATVQVVSEQRYDNTYRPYIEWANIKYQLTPDASIRVGRTVLPSFLLSDSRKVGYANPWIRPPAETYGVVPITNSDGVDASYRVHIGDVVNTALALYGRKDTKLAQGGAAEARRQWAISDTVEYGAASLHVMYQASHLTSTPLNPIFDAFRQFGPQGIALADKYDVKSTPLWFIAAGAMYDPGQWFVMGEWANSGFNSVLGQRTAWYVTGGYRLAKVTPFLSYSQTNVNSNTADPGLDVSALPPFLVEPATGLNVALNAILASTPAQKTISVGARWDFMKNADLKLQYDRTNLGAGSAGTFNNLQPDFQSGGDVDLISVAIDFVL